MPFALVLSVGGINGKSVVFFFFLCLFIVCDSDPFPIGSGCNKAEVVIIIYNVFGMATFFFNITSFIQDFITNCDKMRR